MCVIDQGGEQWVDVGGGALVVVSLLDLHNDFGAFGQCVGGKHGTNHFEEPLLFLFGQCRLKNKK